MQQDSSQVSRSASKTDFTSLRAMIIFFIINFGRVFELKNECETLEACLAGQGRACFDSFQQGYFFIFLDPSVCVHKKG